MSDFSKALAQALHPGQDLDPAFYTTVDALASKYLVNPLLNLLPQKVPKIKKKGPKPGTINKYEVFIKTCADYQQWKQENSGGTYREFQAFVKPRWDAAQSHPELLFALEEQRDAFFEWKEEHPAKKFSEFMTSDQYTPLSSVLIQLVN